MHGFLPNLTAALLALHTVLGCCWHHPHQCTQACTTIESHDTCEDEHADHHGAPADSSHHGHDECQGSACVFLTSPRVAAPALVLQLHAIPAADLPCSGPSVYDIVGDQSFFAADALLPPLRLHLVCQVLLI